jgi:hypothetical protein
MPPVGRSLWRKKTRDGSAGGVKAKTHYPARPATWPGNDEWAPDSAFALVHAGLMNGKSVGYIATKAHAPTAEEIRKNAALASVARIVDEWLLVEYCCCWLPVNPEAVTEVVSKSVAPGFAKAIGLPAPSPAMPDLHEQFAKLLSAIDVAAVTAKSIEEGLASYRGKNLTIGGTTATCTHSRPATADTARPRGEVTPLPRLDASWRSTAPRWA